ncbi:MAG: hypothetical protein HYV77_02720 [Candidatus Wildermuthbacteria bacterium]|nr:hypothetical protein [Candidatus Wildermuthbacteria bacterium]
MAKKLMLLVGFLVAGLVLGGMVVFASGFPFFVDSFEVKVVDPLQAELVGDQPRVSMAGDPFEVTYRVTNASEVTEWGANASVRVFKGGSDKPVETTVAMWVDGRETPLAYMTPIAPGETFEFRFEMTPDWRYIGSVQVNVVFEGVPVKYIQPVLEVSPRDLPVAPIKEGQLAVINLFTLRPLKGEVVVKEIHGFVQANDSLQINDFRLVHEGVKGIRGADLGTISSIVAPVEPGEFRFLNLPLQTIWPEEFSIRAAFEGKGSAVVWIIEIYSILIYVVNLDLNMLEMRNSKTKEASYVWIQIANGRKGNAETCGGNCFGSERGIAFP